MKLLYQGLITLAFVVVGTLLLYYLYKNKKI